MRGAWRELVAGQIRSGLSVQEFCRRAQLLCRAAEIASPSLERTRVQPLAPRGAPAPRSEIDEPAGRLRGRRAAYCRFLFRDPAGSRWRIVPHVVQEPSHRTVMLDTILRVRLVSDKLRSP